MISTSWPQDNPVTIPQNELRLGSAGITGSRSITRAEKQEKFRPKEKCFFLTSPLQKHSSCLWFQDPEALMETKGTPEVHEKVVRITDTL
jgi:hypothetical protein